MDDYQDVGRISAQRPSGLAEARDLLVHLSLHPPRRR